MMLWLGQPRDLRRTPPSHPAAPLRGCTQNQAKGNRPAPHKRLFPTAGISSAAPRDVQQVLWRR